MEHIKIQSLEKTFNLYVRYWFQTNCRQITIWKNKMSFEDIDKNIKKIRYFSLSRPPIIINERMYAEVRFFQVLGYSIQPHLGKHISVTLHIDGNILYLKPFMDTIIINGEPVHIENRLDMIHEGRMYLPLRFLAEYAGSTVTWDPSTEIVTLLYEVKE